VKHSLEAAAAELDIGELAASASARVNGCEVSNDIAEPDGGPRSVRDSQYPMTGSRLL